MRKITLTMSVMLLLLTACSNHKATTSPNNNSRVTVDPNTETTRPVIEQPTDTKIVDLEPTTQVIKTVPIAPPTDVLERIRRGFQFPDINSKYTENYIKWNTTHRSYLKDLFARAEPFLYYIVEEIDKRGLPMELALLPAIESAYKPDAMSRSRASGLWQFIPSTGKSFGLKQNWWYDGRQDFIASTKAALDYLTQLNKMFDGDWHLTLAAYNAGQGTILRAINSNKRKGKSTNYQALNLRSETVKYVPKLQALKEIVRNPDRYNVSLAKIANQPYFETLVLPGQIDLQQFSELAKLDIKTIKHMNAGYLRWATPPEGPNRLLTPISNHVQSNIALQNIEINPNIEYTHHTIARGETLSQIGRRYGVSIKALQNTNKLNGTNIRTGKSLIIPIASQPQAVSRTTSNISNTTNKRIHRVVKGDTLWSISKRYNVDLQKLLSWNQLTKNQILRLNQSLLIFLN